MSLTLDQPRTKDTCGESAHNITRHRRAHHPKDLTRHPLGRLEDDVARKAVRHDHVGHPASDVSALHVTDEPDARLLHETVRLFGEVVTLPRLLADVEEPDASFLLQPEVTFREHTAKNSEIQEILRPAGDGGPGIEQQHGRREWQQSGDRGPAASFQASHLEQRRRDRGAGVSRREERVGLSVTNHPGRDGDAGVGMCPDRRRGLLVHPDSPPGGP